MCMEKQLAKLVSSTELWSLGGCVWLGLLQKLAMHLACDFLRHFPVLSP